MAIKNKNFNGSSCHAESKELSPVDISGVAPRNFFKVRVLLHLASLESAPKLGGVVGKLPPERWCWETASDIAHGSGVNYKSAYVLLPRWRKAKWGYVDGMYMPALLCSDGRPHWFYKLNGRGRSYLARLHKWYEYTDVARAAIINTHFDWPEPLIKIKSVGWQVLAYDEYYKKLTFYSVVMFWPFKNKADVELYYWPISRSETNEFFVCSDIREAVNLIRSVYTIEPSLEVVKLAKAWQEKCISSARCQNTEPAEGSHYAIS